MNSESSLPFDSSATPSLSNDFIPLAPGQKPIGQVGHYVLLEKRGQGGMGVVYKAIHANLKRLVAVKMLPYSRGEDQTAVVRFRREIEAIGRLDHPHIVRATDAGQTDQELYLVMEYLEGIDLYQLVRGQGRLRIADACELMRQTALGLDYIHGKGLVHRDIKPSNLLLETTGRVKILDLGLALIFEDRWNRLTRTGQAMGTADYLAPENILGSHDVDIRADLYSLGCTLFRLVTGQVVFRDPTLNTFYKKMKAHVEWPAPSAGDLRPELPRELEILLGRLLAKKPADRPNSPDEVAKILEPFCQGHDLLALQPEAAVSQTPAAPPTQSGGKTQRTGTPFSGFIPWSKTRRLLAAARWSRRVMLLLFLAAAGVYIFYPRPDADLPDPNQVKPTKDPVQNPQEPWAELAPGQWHNLLDHKPLEIYLPPSNVHNVFYPGKGELWLDSQGFCLFGLGKTETPEGELELEIGFLQHRWVGGAGLFLGYQTTDDPKANYRYSLQRIALDPLPESGQIGAFQITHSLVRLTKDHRPALQLSYGSAAIAPPKLPENRLKAAVGPAGLTGVWWNQENLEGLLKAPGKNPKNIGAFTGIFGIYNFRGASVFSSAKVFVKGKGVYAPLHGRLAPAKPARIPGQ